MAQSMSRVFYRTYSCAKMKFKAVELCLDTHKMDFEEKQRCCTLFIVYLGNACMLCTFLGNVYSTSISMICTPYLCEQF